MDNNAKVTLQDDNQTIERNWSDIKSIEIILKYLLHRKSHLTLSLT